MKICACQAAAIRSAIGLSSLAFVTEPKAYYESVDDPLFNVFEAMEQDAECHHPKK
jgi:hypothetical protein